MILGAASAEDWRQFRGPQGSGRAAGRFAPENWNAFRNVAWETPLPGTGCSSPVVIRDRVWVTAATATAFTAEERAQKATNSAVPGDELQAHRSVTLFALELDVKSGRLLRRIRLMEHDSPPPIHAWNHYASPTPASDGQRLYCHFGALGTAAVDIQTGLVEWRIRLEVDEATGPGNSPIVWRDRLFVACDGRDRQYVAALDLETGRTLWSTRRPAIDAVNDLHKRAFSTPIIVPDQGSESLVSTAAQWLTALDPATGREKWKVNFGAGYSVVPMPVFRSGMIYACTGYPKPQLWAVRAGGSGDVTESHVAWIHDRQVPELSSPLAVDDLIYLASLDGVISCVDAETGARVWHERLDASFHASPIAVGDRLYFTSRDGTTTVLKPGREFHLLGRGQAAGIHQATPAVHDGGLLFRSSEGLYFVREPK